MLYSRAIPVLALAVATGCATNSRRIKMQNEAALEAQNHGLWSRPTEIGFKMGDEISDTAIGKKVFGFNVGESKSGGMSLSIVAGLGGTGASLSQTGQFAAYKAVTGAGAEGIYVTRVESDSSGFFPFFKREQVTVYGRALTIDNYGPIEEERADKWRFRKFGPRTVIIKDDGGGKSGVNLHVDE
jgi:hypothetical protein